MNARADEPAGSRELPRVVAVRAADDEDDVGLERPAPACSTAREMASRTPKHMPRDCARMIRMAVLMSSRMRALYERILCNTKYYHDARLSTEDQPAIIFQFLTSRSAVRHARAWAVSVDVDWRRWFFRIAEDPHVNYTPDRQLRVATGIRF